MRTVWFIASKDLRQRFRDRSAIVLGFVAPLLIATLISFAFRGTNSFSTDVGIVDADHGPIATAFVQTLRRPELRKIIRVHLVATQAEAARRVRSGSLSAAIVLPAGFSRAITSGGGSRTAATLLTNVDKRIAAQVVESIASSFVAQINGDRLSVAAAIAAGVPADQAASLAAAAVDLSQPERIVQRSMGSHPLDAISYYAPGMAIFFLFFAIGFGSRSYFTELNGGTLSRIVAAPVRPIQLLAGKALSVLVYGVASMTVMVVVTTVAFGARWGDPLATAALSLAMVLAVVSLTALVVTVARTERQAEGFASVLVFGLALLGGNFVFVSAAPPVMRRLALFTPNGWALRGFIDLATGSGHLDSVVTPVLAILAFATVAGGIAAWRAPRLVR